MSIVTTIKVDFEKFLKGTETDAEKFAAEFKKLFGAAPNAIQLVINFDNEAAPVILAAVTLADPAVEPAVAGALAIAQTRLAAIQASAVSAQSGQSLVQNLQNFANTVPGLLTGIEVKNPALQAAVTRVVNLIVGEAKVIIPAVQSWIAQRKALAGPPVAAPATGTQALA